MVPHPAIMVAVTPFGTTALDSAMAYGAVMAVHSPISVHAAANHDGLFGYRNGGKKVGAHQDWNDEYLPPW